jgi:hypothetical protein
VSHGNRSTRRLGFIKRSTDASNHAPICKLGNEGLNRIIYPEAPLLDEQHRRGRTIGLVMEEMRTNDFGPIDFSFSSLALLTVTTSRVPLLETTDTSSNTALLATWRATKSRNGLAVASRRIAGVIGIEPC